MIKILFQLQEGNMVSYTLSGLNIPLPPVREILNQDNVYENILTGLKLK